MQPRRHIRCPNCNVGGHLPEGFAKPRIRCPNPNCRHVFDIPPAGELAAESEGFAQKLAAALQEAAAKGGEPATEPESFALADAEVPAGPQTEGTTQPSAASPAARPRSPDAGTPPDRSADAPVVPRSESDAGRRRWAVAAVGGLALAALVIGIVVWLVRPDNNKQTLREPVQLAQIEAVPEPPAAGPIPKDESPIAKVADAKMKPGDPAEDVPANAAPAERPVPRGTAAEPAAPADPPPTEPRAPDPDAVPKPAAPEPRVAPIAAPAPAADRLATHRILDVAGLTRYGNSYILREELEAIRALDSYRQKEAELARINNSLRSLERRYDEVKNRENYRDRMAADKRREASRLRMERDQHGQPTRTDEVRGLEDEADRLSEEASRERQPELDRINREAAPLIRERDAVVQEGQHLQSSYVNLVAQARRRYPAVTADPRVKAALRTLNKGRQPKLALGPVEAYEQNIVKAALETLAAIGLRAERGAFYLPEEADFIKKAAAADLLRREVGMQEKKLRELQAAAGPAASAPAATRPPASPDGASAAIKGQAAPNPEEEVRRVTGHLLDARAKFVRQVADLRRLGDAILARQQALALDIEVRDCLAEINRVRRDRTGLETKPGFKPSLQKLEEMESLIRTERIP